MVELHPTGELAPPTVYLAKYFPTVVDGNTEIWLKFGCAPFGWKPGLRYRCDVNFESLKYVHLGGIEGLRKGYQVALWEVWDPGFAVVTHIQI